MRNLSQLGCCAFAATALFLTGCQQMIKPQAPATPSVQAENQFQLQGKIGRSHPSTDWQRISLPGYNSRKNLILSSAVS